MPLFTLTDRAVLVTSAILNVFLLYNLKRRISQTTKPEENKPDPPPTPRALHTREYFYIGGSYAPHGPAEIHHGQMYVEHLTPARVTRSIPILFIHGNGMTGTNWLNTPDGRPGWSDYFLNQGYEVRSLCTSRKCLHSLSRYTLSTNPLGDDPLGSPA